ncbi:DUF1642 domain-containing protein [Pediococcus acidilactici]|uniref:DUF1642 domain-containing protein n=1 Tax=Pediococcus acidilactici TaxID=1254 RepID=UPI001322C89B|nr:DUF1642 domain-containing protein [Pediococcus acidilactici]KAF0339763.1 DUF1642 domain-containing protein [Pediococcus acidilactici]KAF0379726.1 DUF1642 domain-containing protein [Pediococcus acidilactici]KAF0388413.1 DUF1642 domain-containing protein [Pediococcus acidilactici]KAF0452966.1 DUF1642 domain-containing protein [Pediococcus acidilactici]KAF0462245.1 DUF1642 domain-containing protein [Pediococcus acidilactici]
MTIEEVKEELTKRMAEAHSDYIEDPVGGEYSEGYASGCEYAIELLEDLQEKKVVIPQFAVDLIEKAKVYYGDAVSLFKIVYWIGNHAGSIESHYKWLNDEGNQKLLLNAVVNGYEVENKIEKYVRLKGFWGGTGYLNYDVTFEKFFVDTTELDGCTKIKFTKSWLKDNWSEYEAYNNAGLLEFEEVEDE